MFKKYDIGLSEMKKLFLYFFIFLMFCNITLAQSSLPECDGNDIKSSLKKFFKIKKWTNCYGKATFSSGDIYVGEFYNGHEHGQGTLTFLNGSIHIGQFKDGKFYGYGTHISADGRKYVGQWENGTHNGQGTLTETNGDQYVGKFKRGYFHGLGTFTFADGTIDKGIWRKGKLIIRLY